MKDYLWTWIHVASVLGLFVTGVGIYLARYWMKDEPDAILPNELDFLDSIGYVVLYTAIRYLFDEMFRNEVYKRVKLNDPINFELKKDKSLKEAFCSAWYLAMTIMGVYFFANTDYLPTPCFGSGNCEDMPRKLFTRENHWTVRMYFMIQFAYHTHTLVYYELANRKKKLPEYNEMMLHHILAVGLIILCYTSGYFNYGISFLMIADFTDFFLNLGKADRDLRLTQGWKIQLFDLCFAGVVVSCTYLRAYVIPWCVLRSCYLALWKTWQGQYNFWDHPTLQKYASKLVAFYAVKAVLLSVLGIMNFYWVTIILQMTYRRIFLKQKTPYANPAHGDKMESGERDIKPKED